MKYECRACTFSTDDPTEAQMHCIYDGEYVSENDLSTRFWINDE